MKNLELFFHLFKYIYLIGRQINKINVGVNQKYVEGFFDC